MADLIPIYSISKPFLAEAVIALGVPLDTPVGKFVPDLLDCYKSRVLAELLNHTSGLDDYGDMPEYRQAVKEGKPAWDREFLLALASKRNHVNPGFRYSNIGYLLLVLLIERETQLPYFQAITKLVLSPLETYGFEPWLSRHSNIPDYDPNWVYSGTFLGDPELIAPSLLKLARYRDESIGLNAGITPVSHPNTGFEQPGYGLGFMTDAGSTESEPRYVGHGGGGPGFNLMALVNTVNWKSELEYSTGEFDQSKAITSLIHKLSN